jgi:hypothetical protein
MFYIELQQKADVYFFIMRSQDFSVCILGSPYFSTPEECIKSAKLYSEATKLPIVNSYADLSNVIQLVPKRKPWKKD